jgi:hypothetical protein
VAASTPRCLTEIRQENVQDSLDTAGILTVADEPPQLPLEDLPLLLGLRANNLGKAIVGDLGRSRIPVEKLLVRNWHQPLLFAVIGVAR